MTELADHIAAHGAQGNVVKWTGALRVDPGELDRAIKDGWAEDGLDGWAVSGIDNGVVLLAPKPNLVTNSGVQIALDRTFGLNGPPAAVARMGVDDGVSNPVAGTDASGGSRTKTLRTFDSAATRSAQTVSAVGTFNDVPTGGIGAVGFVMKRLFLSNHGANITNALTADTAGTLYAMTNLFTIDLTAFTTWSQTFTAQVTGVGT